MDSEPVTDILLEFKGGPLDGERILKDEWPKDQTLPGTELVDKGTGELYRYHVRSSSTHPIYTHRPRA